MLGFGGLQKHSDGVLDTQTKHLKKTSIWWGVACVVLYPIKGSISLQQGKVWTLYPGWMIGQQLEDCTVLLYMIGNGQDDEQS